MVLRRVVYVNNGGNILFLSGVSLLFLSLSLFFTQRERHCHHTDLVFFQDSVLLKRELLKTATLNVPGVRPGYGNGLFFPSSFSLGSFVLFNFSSGTRRSLFRQLLSCSSTRPASLSLCRFPGPSRDSRVKSVLNVGTKSRSSKKIIAPRIFKDVAESIS